jgi:tRNA pseudouridine55 synthase
MDGFLRVLKPPGMTSHDVVQYARRVLRTRAVGHTGTLDPAAAGLLVLTVGRATRLGEYLLDCDKGYRAEVTLGLTTDTADSEGRVTERVSAAGVTEAAVQAVLAGLIGPLTMRPPTHSAVRVGGRHLYELARRDEAVVAPERTVTIHELALLQFIPGEHAATRFDVTCSKGTYVRSLAEMMGERLGVGGMLSALLRTRVGPHRLADAATLEEIANTPEVCLLTPAAGLPHLQRVAVEASQECAFVHGNPVAVGARTLPPGPLVVVNGEGLMLGIGEAVAAVAGQLRPRKVLSATD